MLLEVCKCSDPTFTVQNLGGFKKCPGGMGVARGAIFSTETKLGGGVNGLDLATETPNKAFFDSKTLDPVIQDRWAVMEGIETFASPVIAPNQKVFDSGRIHNLPDTAGKQVSWFIPTGEAPKLKAKLDSIIDCRANVLVSFYDTAGNWGVEKTDTHVKGRLMQEGSYFSQVVNVIDNDIEGLIVTFNWDVTALETAVDYVEPSSMDGFRWATGFSQPVDGRIVYGASLLTSISYRIQSDTGGVNTLGGNSKIGLGGLTEANHIVTDVTAPLSPITLSGTTSETPTGSGDYVFTYTAPISSGKIVKVEAINAASSNYIELGYDLKTLSLTQAPVPSA